MSSDKRPAKPCQRRVGQTGLLAISILLAPVSPPLHAGVEEVVVVFKTHFDIGYTDMASNVVQRYRTTMIDDALEVVDQNRDLPPAQQFAWTIPGWPATKILEDWPGQSPDRQARIRQAFREGRFVTHALPFTTHTELLGPEDLVRGLGFATRLAGSLDLELPRDAKMTDVPSHSWVLPTLLRHAGVDFLHLGCNAASSSPKVPRLFWWEGPDRSRLLTMYTAESYGTGLVAPADWPCKTWLALIHTGDNHGPPRPDEVRKLLDEAKAKLPGVKVRIGRLSDFADAILAENPDLPVIRGDMPDTWIHGPMSDPQGASLARRLRPKIAMTEMLDTLLPLWGVTPPPANDTIPEAYEQSLLYGEHTWGGAYWWIYGNYTAHYGEAWQAERKAGRFDRIESSWAEHTAYIEKAEALVEPLLKSQLTALAKAVKHDGNRMLIFNPLPWPRWDGVAQAELDEAEFFWPIPAALQEVEPISTETLRGAGWRRRPPLYRRFYDVRDGRIRCLAPIIPPSGYVVLKEGNGVVETFLHAPRLDVNNATMNSGRFAVQFDVDRGSIESLRVPELLLSSLRLPEIPECVDRSSPYGFGQLLYERFDSNQVHRFVDAYVKIDSAWATNELGKPMLPPASLAPSRSASPTGFTVSYAHSTLVAAEAEFDATASPGVPFGITTRYVFYNGLPYFDIEVTIHDKPADPWPEAAWLCLPFKVDSPQFRLGRLGAVVDPERELVPGSNNHLFALDTGLAVFDSSGTGFGVCPLDSPLVSLGEPGCWKYSTDFKTGKATVFVNLFNNQWTTNFRLWNEGTWTSRVRIWAFHDYDSVESLIRPSLEARYPLQAVCVSGPGGSLPTGGSGLSVGHWNSAPVTAFGSNPDGTGTLLRLWEMAGKPGSLSLQLPPGMDVLEAQPVDLRGRPAGMAIPVEDGEFTVPLRAFAPASFVLRETAGSAGRRVRD
jgi:hypothetical protein